MILTEKIEVKISRKNIDYYSKIKDGIKLKDKILINVSDLQKGSNKRIEVKCDICETEKNVSYNDYNKNIKKYNFYSCTKCKNIKLEMSLLEKYGVKNAAHIKGTPKKKKKTCLEKYGKEYALQSKSVIEKRKVTNIEKYGHSCALLNDKIKEKTLKTNLKKFGDVNPQKNKEVRKKQKDTNIEKYGHSCALLNDKVKEKTIKTNLEKYGVDHFSKSDNYKIKYKQTSMDNFGVNHPSKHDDIKEKNRQTCIERYGVNSYFKTNEYKTKFKATMIEKYGVDNYFKFEDFKIKMREDLIKNGFNVCSDNIQDWSKYKRICLTLSRRNYNKLKNEWNGYDYYNNQYIKENYLLNPNDTNYPTIDHKISILYGFLNNISPEEISEIENLCITKRAINSSKRSLTEEAFRTITNTK